MEQAKELFNKTITNIRKSPNRKYTRDTIIAKLRDLEKENIDRIIFDNNSIDTKLEAETIDLYGKAKDLLVTQLIETDNSKKMADFNMETAMKIIPNFTGSHKEIDRKTD